MADWIDHLTQPEAQAILDAPIRTRFEARNDRGEKVTRYTAPSSADLIRIKAKAGG